MKLNTMSTLPQCMLLAAVLLAAAIPGVCSTEAAAPRAPQTRAILDETDGHDLSPESEARYTRSVLLWLETLPPRQREQARKILREAHPDVQVLRMRIRETKARLESLAFDRGTPTDTLPRLGLELQMLRNRLRARLSEISELLRTEVGVPMGPIGEEGYWLNPGSDEAPGRTGTPVSAPAGR
ncbi:MAG: periplasmic heavy metal sensor [Desulfovibrio sp.]|nr:periplasmic heavy metal sensor [Desulfovibrio sp.]